MPDGRGAEPPASSTPPGGSGRRGRIGAPKGRQVDPEARRHVTALLGTRPRDRDQLIQFLHLIQDQEGSISAPMLAALAEAMKLSQAEVFEVATFYAHFDVVPEGAPPPPPLTVRVCESLSCEMAGAQDLLRALEDVFGDDVRVIPGPCMGRCEAAPVAWIGRRHVDRATVDSVRETVAAGAFQPTPATPQRMGAYVAAGGYALLKRCLAGETDRAALIETLEASGLRGLGGAGFPSGRKWRIVSSHEGPRYVAVNADEGEPGTIKDRYLLEDRPHRMLEGMLIAAWAMEAPDCYIYLRDEYPLAHDILEAEIQHIAHAGLASHSGEDTPLPARARIHLRRGAGAYICGEESAMLESLEGKRGLPRHKPPYPAEVGLFGRPTLIHNVETLSFVPEILARGADWWRGLGRHGGVGQRYYSVSGRVREPGPKLAPAGITARELIDEFCGGMAEGHVFKGYLPGGASGGILPAAMADIPLDFGHLEKHDCFVGSGAVVVLSDQDNTRDAALNLMRFFEHESCGQCTPCRVGTEKAVALMRDGHWDEGLLSELAETMADASICGLGQAAPNPVRCVLSHFRDDL